MNEKSGNSAFLLLLVVSMVMWSFAWPIGKMAGEAMAPQPLVFYRILISFLCLLPFPLIQREKLKGGLRTVLMTAAAGFLLCLYNQFYFMGLRKGLAGAGGVLVTSINPIFTYLLAGLLFRRKMPPRAVAGLALGLAGGLILLNVWNLAPDSLLQSGNLFFILAALSWAGLSLVSQQVQKSVSFRLYSCLTYGFGALFSLFFALPSGLDTIAGASPVFYGQLAFLSVGAMAFASSVYFLAAGKLGGDRASSFIFIVPAVALCSSWVLLGETPPLSTLIGGTMAVAAVYLINGKARLLRRRKK